MTDKLKLSFLLFVVLGVFISLFARCFFLQYFKNDHYQETSQRQKQKKVFIKPQRGIILDSQGRVLAASNKIQSIYADPKIIEDVEEFAKKLAPIIGIPWDLIAGEVRESRHPRYCKLKTRASREEVAEARKIYGVGIETDWERYYPAGALTSHVVGFTSGDNRGLAGVEYSYNDELTGEKGEQIFYADTSRRPVRLKEQKKGVEDGVGIILTIDSTIQQFVREELMKRFREYEAEAGYAIVAEPKTGAILAMVSLPDFNPDNFFMANAEWLKNRAITDEFEPGSIFKPLVSAIALNENVISKTEKIYCEDGYYAGKGFGSIKEYRYKKYGNLDVKGILINSSNIGMAKIGQKLGKDKLYRGVKFYGFGQETGIDIPGEADGLLRTPDKWTGYSVTRIPFGQEVTVTALQIIKGYCILANGGHLVKPYLVKAVVDAEGDIKRIKRETSSVGYVIKPEVAEWMVEDALSAVVNEGTGKRAKLDRWQVFGKTGTANIALENARGYSKDHYVASFVAGAPAEDPKIVVLVSIRKPNKSLGKGYTGGAVSSPVAAKIIERTLEYMDKRDKISRHD